MRQAMNNVLLLSVLSGLAWADSAAAQSPPGEQSGQQPQTTDRSPAISASEHAANAQAMFKRMDADGDGSLTTAELDAGHRMMMGAGMHRGMGPGTMGKGMGKGMGPGMGPGMMDLDGDGAISAKEHADMASAMFQRMDGDGDGRVSAAEMASAHAMMKGGEGMMGAGTDPGMMGPGMMGAGMVHGMKSAELIQLMDLDGDGRISATEYSAGSRAMFEEADSNKDGTLSMDERAAHHELMMQRGNDAEQKPGEG